MFSTNSTTGVGRWRESMYNKHQQLGCWMCFGVVCVWGVWGRSEMLITTVVTDYWSSSKQLLNAAPKGSASDLYGLSWLTWVTVWRSLFTFHWGGFVFKWVVRDSTWRSIKIIDHYDRLKALNWVLVCVCVCVPVHAAGGALVPVLNVRLIIDAWVYLVITLWGHTSHVGSGPNKAADLF